MKRVFITGASSGLGEGLAVQYAQPGSVIGLSARREDELKRVADQVEAKGARAIVIPLDVTDTDACERAVGAFVDQAGGLDLAVANAGVSEGGSKSRMDAHSTAQVMSINVIGLTNTLMPCIAAMKKQGSGVLVGMASVAGYRAIPGSLSYSSSKAAVMTFMEGLQLELRGSGIHAMTICPGFIRTPMTDKNQFNMPFILDRDKACQRMKKAIDRKKTRYTFPFPMFVAAQFMKVMPLSILAMFSPKWDPEN